MEANMANQSDSTFPSSQAPQGHPVYHSGIGLTQWLALGLVAFTLLMVIIAVAMNLLFGSPGG